MSTSTIDPTTAFDLSLVKKMYTEGVIEDEPETLILAAVAYHKRTMELLTLFNPLKLLPVFAAVEGYQNDMMTDCPCGEPDCIAHAIFLILPQVDRENWQPAPAYTMA